MAGAQEAGWEPGEGLQARRGLAGRAGESDPETSGESLWGFKQRSDCTAF